MGGKTDMLSETVLSSFFRNFHDTGLNTQSRP
nr:hypothetical protein [Tanacetum cinerariifolium]